LLVSNLKRLRALTMLFHDRHDAQFNTLKTDYKGHYSYCRVTSETLRLWRGRGVYPRHSGKDRQYVWYGDGMWRRYCFGSKQKTKIHEHFEPILLDFATEGIHADRDEFGGSW